MNAELAPSIPAQAWDFLWSAVVFFWDGLVVAAGFVWMLVSLFWAALQEFVFPIIWPLIEPVFGPVVEYFQVHTWQLIPVGYFGLVLVSLVFQAVTWLRLSPEQKAERRRLEAEAYARAEPERQAKAAKKKAAAAKRQAADDEHSKACQREYDDYYAWKDQQDAYQASHRS